MTLIACESKLHLILRSSIDPYPGNTVPIRRGVVYYARLVRAFFAGIKCWHCILKSMTTAFVGDTLLLSG